ncbi:MAG: amidohydrolase family protein [Deltaproteobacteria bacterium]|nr:amidohydrolase family protein [Deltaproteobacteria bacterium]
MRRLPKGFLLALGCILLVAACQRRPAAPRPNRKIDMHAHFGPDAVQHVIELMDHYGVDAIVNLSGGIPGHGLEQQLGAAARYPGRIFVFANLDWRQPLMGPGYGERMAAGLQRARALGARGIKIPKALGLGFTDYTGTLIKVDEPELDPVFERAGELGLPIAIHVGDPVAFWQPLGPENERFDELRVHPEWSFHGKPVPSWEELFAALERRVARHPRTTFISVHFGNAPEYPERVSALLDRYSNLLVDTAARVPEIGRHPARDMRALFQRHADRILFGTDLGVGVRQFDLMLGSTSDKPPTQSDVDHFFASTFRYFESGDRGLAHPTPIQGRWTIEGISLPPEVLRKVYGTNAERILGMTIPDSPGRSSASQ